MKIKDLLLAQLDREAPTTRRALEKVPEGKSDWKPHPKSTNFGYLSTLVAIIPSWVASIVEKNELDLGKGETPAAPKNNRELVALFDQSIAAAKRALAGTNDEHLMKPWQLKVSGKVVEEKLRHIMIADTLMHLAHHRGQMTVYLRLNEQAVPSIYGPTADEKWS